MGDDRNWRVGSLFYRPDKKRTSKKRASFLGGPVLVRDKASDNSKIARSGSRADETAA